VFHFTTKERRFFIIAAALITAGGLLRICGWQPESPVLPDAVQVAALDKGPVNINSASQEEMLRLPGIGPVLAKRIITYRQANGNFTCVEDLDKVKGFGSKAMERLKGKVTVDDETRVASRN
jgi:comEA protein